MPFTDEEMDRIADEAAAWYRANMPARQTRMQRLRAWWHAFWGSEDAGEIEELERMQGALHDIVTWCDAYPLDIFPEPDLQRARQLLEAGGITIDAVSASAMRHCLEGVRRIAVEAIGREASVDERDVEPREASSADLLRLGERWKDSDG